MKTITNTLVFILEMILLILLGIEIFIRGLLFTITLFKIPKLVKNKMFIGNFYNWVVLNITSKRVRCGKWKLTDKCFYCDEIVNRHATWCKNCNKQNFETEKVHYYTIEIRECYDGKTNKTYTETRLVSILIILLLFTACKKEQSQPIPVNNAAPCQVAFANFAGKFYTYNTAKVDTLTIKLVQNNCPNISNSNKYELNNLGEVMTTWGVGIEYRKYYVDCDESTQKGSITDTLKLDLFDYDNLRISVKDNGVFTPFLILKRK